MEDPMKLTHRLSILFAAGLICSACILTACSNDDDSSSVPRRAQTIAYEANISGYVINNDIGTLTIQGLSSGQTLALAKTNPTENLIRKENTHYISKGSNITLNVSGVQSRSSLVEEKDTDSAETKRPCYSMQLAEITRSQMQNLSSSARAVKPDYVPTDRTKEFNIGDKKHFYLDVDIDNTRKVISKWSEGDATLEAIGKKTDGSPICYIWVLGEVTSHYENGTTETEETTLTTDPNPKKGKVNRALAEEYATEFVKIYDLDRTIFGTEPTKVRFDAQNDLKDMKYLSETGTIINLLFFDIGGKKANATTCGFYWSKDLYPNDKDYKDITGDDYSPDSSTKYSNEGNYLYINAYMSDQTGSMLTTIVHEFQHMLHENMKSLAVNQPFPETTFNEMMSVAAEDLMFMFFPKITYKTETAMNYMKECVTDYLYNGIEYNPAKGFLYYGTGYSFAGWVMRQYGIAAIREASWCEDRNWASIVKGINAVKDKDMPIQTEETILRDYAATCIKGMVPVSKQQPYVYFTNTASTDPSQEKYYCSSQSYGYPLTRIYTNSRNDITTTGFETSSPEYKRKIDGLDLSQFGYIELRGFEKYDANQIADLRPYGMMLHELGKSTNTSDITLTFSSDSTPSASERLYLIVY